MSKKARLRKRLADIDLNDEEIEATESSSSNSKGFAIRNKYSLNDVHKTFLDLCLYEKTKMVFVLLANRVHPTAKNTFGDLNVRGKVMEEIFNR